MRQKWGGRLGDPSDGLGLNEEEGEGRMGGKVLDRRAVQGKFGKYVRKSSS